MEKLDIYLANIRSRVTFFSIDSGHNFLNALSVTMITKKTSSLENVDCQGNKTCRKVQKVFRSRRKTNLHRIEKDELCICWTYDTILKKEFRFMEDYGYVFVHKLTQFLTTLNFGRNCCLGLIPENVMNSIFHSFGTAYHWLHRKLEVKIGYTDTERHS